MMRSLFCLSDETVKEIIDKKTNYENVPKDKENEKIKEANLEKQARVNFLLEKAYSHVCKAIQEACRKENCLLYGIIKIDEKQGWACREYKVDFPDADFDSRYHVPLVGEDRVNVLATIKHLETLKEKGARFYCVSCGQVYGKTREELKKEGKRDSDVCNCEDFLFKPIENFIDFLKNREEKKV